MSKRSLVILPLAICLSACTDARNALLLLSYETALANSSPEDTTVTDVTATTDARGEQARILSAFFGLDNGLPKAANRAVCRGAGGKDGMPVIFSHEIDFASMQAGDFKVTSASGKVGEITCVTLAPADDSGELRTALLVGEYGSIDDQPARVEIVGNLLSSDQSVNFKGTSITPIALEAGPTIVLAELIPEDQLELGKEPTPLPWGGGSGCPVGTKQVVNVTWVGGVTKPGGREADDVERQQYQVTVQQADGSAAEVTPRFLADLVDGDNNHRLCLDVGGKPTSVFFPAGFLTDPRDDPNPETSMVISER